MDTTAPLRQCTAKSKRSGKRCGKTPIVGGTVCHMHGGKIPRVKAKAALRVELRAWGLDAPTVNPVTTMIKLVSQSAMRVEIYSTEIAEFIQVHHGRGVPIRDALVGQTWITVENDDGESESVRSGEYLRGIVQLEMQERRMCADLCKIAIGAGLAQAQLDMAQQQGQLMAGVLRAIMDDPRIALNTAQRTALPDVAREYIARATRPTSPAIEA